MTESTDINKIQIARDLFDFTIDGLRRVGLNHFECFALWLGIKEMACFNILEVLFPKQTGHKLPSGVCVTIDSDELHRINVYLYEHKLSMFVQLHTHPSEAYHSETDDTYPIVTKVGSLSIVIPDFAADEPDLRRWAFYRLASDRQWIELDQTQKLNLLEIVNK